MRNKSFFWVLTILLVVVTIWSLSLTWVAAGVENDADSYAQTQYDSIKNAMADSNDSMVLLPNGSAVNFYDKKAEDEIKYAYVDSYLKEMAEKPVYPILGHTYKYCKESGLNFGLDLQGGMSVTLEMSIPEFVQNKCDNYRDPEFFAAYLEANKQWEEGKSDKYLELFVSIFQEKNGTGKLAAHFHSNNDGINAGDSDEKVVEYLTKQINTALDGVEVILEKRVNQFGVAQPTITKEPLTNRITVELPGVKDQESVERKLKSTANIEFFAVHDNGEIGPLIFNQAWPQLIEKYKAEEGIADVEEKTADANIEEKADDTTKVEENNNAPQIDLGLGDDSTKTANDTVKTNVAEDNTINNDSTSAIFNQKIARKYFPLSPNLVEGKFRVGDPSVGYASYKDTAKINKSLKDPAMADILMEYPNLKLMWSAKPYYDPKTNQPTEIHMLYAIKIPEDGRAEVSGKDIDKAYKDYDQRTGSIIVSMKMNGTGTDNWAAMTEKYVDKIVAITMDNMVWSAPTVNEIMTTGSSQISGNFTNEEADELAGLLSAGALPAPMIIVDQSVVGATLGADNVNSGIWSFIIALLMVLAYMIFYYARAGVVANVALVTNIFLIFGALASFKAVLTLPGIAGIVLTIGMSVDANVLIFERIREELRGGKGVKLAIKDGYQKALAAILDANITTLLTAIVLKVFGSGPIESFATSLIIGIFTSVFAALVITRLIFIEMFDKKKEITFSTKMTRNFLTNANYAFIKKRKIFYIVSGLVVAGGIASLATRGLDYGVEFTGGRTYQIEFENEVDYQKLKVAIGDEFVDQDGNRVEPEVKQINNKFTALIKTKFMENSTAPDVDSLVNTALSTALEKNKADFGDYEILEQRKISPSISNSLRTSSVWAVVISLIIIFLYILIRFRKPQFGVGALLAMAHDVIVVLAIFSIFKGIMPFSMEINQAFIAAILTVVGYSINDTVVVFDRIREYIGLHKRTDEKEVVNNALNSTLSRTINTSVSTFIVLLMIFIFGGESIRGFIFALMIGVVVGTYSSLCVATPLVIDLSRNIKSIAKPVKREESK
ncbi:MAG: protein translocase subunit SecDF [Crocinitomicaceae bacterium]|nr:protein translocase subunit SecDF [Crocinitomicaceae bacterium]